MARLLIHVEGPTEGTFVDEVLKDYLKDKGYEAVDARLIGKAPLRAQRGGILPWTAVRGEIRNHLKEDASCIATTMVDFYGLPQDGERAWPGRTTARSSETIEEAMLNDMSALMGGNFNPRRFVPFIVMHEFEGLLFSDCEAFSEGISRPDLRAAFQSIRDGFTTPEEINDSPMTAPSKRILDLYPGYEKPLFGNIAILEIGLERIRSECPHFDGWLKQLEARIG